MRDEESPYLLSRGLLSLIYGSDVAPPDNYKDFVTKVRKIALNLDINYGYQHASGSSGTNNRSPPPQDRRTGTGVTYGGSGRAMEIDAMGPQCYNCGKFGHIANKCTSPKREKGTCFECGSKDHMIKDCPVRKKKLAAKKPGQKRPFGRSARQENVGTDDSPAEENHEGDDEKETENDAEEDSHFGERDE